MFVLHVYPPHSTIFLKVTVKKSELGHNTDNREKITVVIFEIITVRIQMYPYNTGGWNEIQLFSPFSP